MPLLHYSWQTVNYEFNTLLNKTWQAYITRDLYHS